MLRIEARTIAISTIVREEMEVVVVVVAVVVAGLDDDVAAVVVAQVQQRTMEVMRAPRLLKMNKI